MEFLSLADVRAREAAVCQALDDLLRVKSVAPKPRARQWRFLRACTERLFSDTPSEFDGYSANHAAQLKHEVEARLRPFYAGRQPTLRIAFALAHRRQLAAVRSPEAREYPGVAGYCVLVRDLAADVPLPPRTGVSREYLERVVVEACDAEFRAYAAMPAMDLTRLREWFDPDGPAYETIAGVLQRRKDAGTILTNRFNPSCHRVMSVQVRRADEDEATVGTAEYWYIAWWDPASKQYVHVYRETNRQTYLLRHDLHGWRVWENRRPRARTLP